MIQDCFTMIGKVLKKMFLWDVMMTDESLDLFCEHSDCEDATIEEIAESLEITVDYYLMEFI